MVVDAYQRPLVENSDEKFGWGKGLAVDLGMGPKPKTADINETDEWVVAARDARPRRPSRGLLALLWLGVN